MVGCVGSVHSVSFLVAESEIPSFCRDISWFFEETIDQETKTAKPFVFFPPSTDLKLGALVEGIVQTNLLEIWRVSSG